MELDERIVPKQLVVGTHRHLCYVTYYEEKNKKIELNSKKSWTQWSDNSKDPIVVDNKFSDGFKLAGVNGRWSSNAKNAENLLIEHPLFGYCFEIPISRLVSIAKDCIIENGVIKKELIMDKKRGLLTLAEYNKAIEDLDKETKEKEEKQAKIKSKPVKEQVPGKIYIDHNGNEFLFIAKVKITFKNGESEVRHIYNDYFIKRDYPFYDTTYNVDRFLGDNRNETITISGLLFKTSTMNSPAFNVPRNLVLKNPKKLYESDKNDNLFEGYTEETWNDIEKAMNNFMYGFYRYNGSDWETNGIQPGTIQKVEIV